MRTRKPLWREGVYLYPQHAQAQDSYHEDLLALHRRASHPHGWGVLDVEIDETALRAGQLRVERLEAILPDGTPLVVGGAGNDPLAPRPIEGFVGATTSVDVYVGLVRESPIASNVDMVGDPTSAVRYRRATSTLPDLVTGRDEDATDVEWLRHNPRILFGEERRDTFDTIRIAQLVRGASGSIVARPTFVPPVMRIGASPFLVDGFRRVHAAMMAKQQSVAASRRQRTQSAVEFQALDAAKFWLLHTLNGMLPVIAEIVDKPDTPPREAHLALAQLLGQLCTFDAEANPNTIPRFNYLELGNVFESMFAHAIALLDAVIADRYKTIPVVRHESGVFIAQLQDPAFLRSDLFLAVSGGVPAEQVRHHFPTMAKIAASHQINTLMNSALSGVRIALEYQPPAALPLRPGVVFFRLERAGDFWTNIVSAGNLVIQQPFDPALVELALYAVDAATLQ